MGFGGWNELKEAYLKEEEYLQTHFKDIDANLPFQRRDSIMSIAGKIAALKKEAIDDTQSLLTHDDLQKAILIMRKASYMGIYAASNNLLFAREFQHNMARIGKRVDICHYHSIPMLYVFPAVLPWEVMAVILVELVVDLLPLHPIKSYYL